MQTTLTIWLKSNKSAKNYQTAHKVIETMDNVFVGAISHDAKHYVIAAQFNTQIFFYYKYVFLKMTLYKAELNTLSKGHHFTHIYGHI